MGHPYKFQRVLHLGSITARHPVVGISQTLNRGRHLCSAGRPRRETRLNLRGCLKLPDGSQPLVGQSSPYCWDVWRTYRCLRTFFPIVDTYLSCEDVALQSCAMVPRWRLFGDFFGSCISSEPRAAHFRPASVGAIHWFSDI